MSVSRKDVQFLRSIVNRMEKDRWTVYKPSSNRNAYAMILRFKGNDGVCVSRMFSPHDINGIQPREILNRLDVEAQDNHPSSLTMLYVKQKDTQEHRWSSSIIFPGGKRDNDEDKDDISAVRRHAYSQLGIPLRGQFVLLGRLPDIWNYSRDLQGGTVNTRFVFLHIGDMTPTLKLQNHIVKSTAWVPLSLLTRSHVTRDRVKHQFYSYLRSGSLAHREVRDVVSNTMMYFPSIQLPGDLGEHFGDIWGSTLSWSSTLLAYDRRRRLDWPIVHTDSLFLQHFVIYPVHGYLELTKHECCEGEPMNPLHISCLFMIVWIAMAIFAFVMHMVTTTLYVIYDATFAGGGRGKSLTQQATEEAAELHSTKNFFNIPWQLLNPREADTKIGAPTQQENQEIMETKIMFNKLVEQVEKAPIPKGGAVVIWSQDESKNPVRSDGDNINDNEKDSSKKRAQGSENPEVQSTLVAVDSETEYYTSLRGRDNIQEKLDQKRREKFEQDEKIKEKNSMRLKKVAETPSTSEFGSGLFHQALAVGAGGYSSSVMAEEARMRRQQYSQEYKDKKLEGEHEELSEVVQGLVDATPNSTEGEKQVLQPSTPVEPPVHSVDVENKFFEETEQP